MHIDTKKLGRIPEGGGKRFARGQRASRQVGSEYVHVAVDDRTRVEYSERLGSERAGDAAAFTARALRFFADQGIRVRQVMIDDHFSYDHGAAFKAALASAGVEHVRIPRYTPRWNGKAEAFVGILLREWAYARPYTSNRARAIAFLHFNRKYNYRRRHGELPGLTPMQRLLADVNNVCGKYSWCLMESSDLSVSEVRMMRASESGPIVARGDAADALRLVEVRGSAFEMGRQHGDQSKHLIRGFLDALLVQISRKGSIGKAVGEQDLLRRTEPYMSYVERELPHLAEEIRGIAEGAGVSAREIHLLNIQGDLRYGLLSGCTSFAVASPDGVLIGQNFDFPPTFQDFVQLLHASPLDGPRILAFGLAGTLPHRGSNSEGLVLVGNGLGSPNWRTGVSTFFTDRQALAQTSIEQAVGAVRRLTRSKSTNMLMTDPSEQILDLETTPYEDRVLGPTDGILVHGNHYSHPDFESLEPLAGLNDSPVRVARLRTLLEAQRAAPSLSDIVPALGDHVGYPVSVCRHETDGGASHASHSTVGSIVAQPSRGLLHACRGNPCQTTYRTYKV